MLNETNITIDVASILINSPSETNDILKIIAQFAIPIFSILITGIVTGFTAYYTIKNNARNIFIQANKTKIEETIKELSEFIVRGQNHEILNFLNSSDGIYIPEQIKSEIRIYAKEKIDTDIQNKMLDSISKYINP